MSGSNHSTSQLIFAIKCFAHNFRLWVMQGFEAAIPERRERESRAGHVFIRKTQTFCQRRPRECSRLRLEMRPALRDIHCRVASPLSRYSNSAGPTRCLSVSGFFTSLIRGGRLAIKADKRERIRSFSFEGQKFHRLRSRKRKAAPHRCGAVWGDA